MTVALLSAVVMVAAAAQVLVARAM